MGSHPSNPSYDVVTGRSLQDVIRADPYVLGDAVEKRFGKVYLTPFDDSALLLTILIIATASLPVQSLVRTQRVIDPSASKQSTGRVAPQNKSFRVQR